MSADREIELEEAALAISEANEKYLHGECHIFALALSEVSGRPCAALMDYDHDIGGDCLVHAFVTDWPGIIDIKGLRQFGIAQAREEFPCSDEASAVVVSTECLLGLGEGSTIMTAEIRARIDAALPIAKAIFGIARQQQALCKAPAEAPSGLRPKPAR